MEATFRAVTRRGSGAARAAVRAASNTRNGQPRFSGTKILVLSRWISTATLLPALRCVLAIVGCRLRLFQFAHHDVEPGR